MDDLAHSPESSNDTRIRVLEQKMAALEYKIPETGVISDNFMKRAFVIWGHNFIAELIIGFGVMICVGVFLLFLMVAGVAIFN